MKNRCKGTGTGDDLMAGQDGTATDEPFFLWRSCHHLKGEDWINSVNGSENEPIIHRLLTIRR